MFMKIMGYGTVVLGILLGIGSAIGAIRKDALNDCNVRWENKINQEISDLKLKIAEKDRVIADKDRRILAAVAAADDAMKKAKEDLEKQRANEPLSKACAACRVPNSYIWLRNKTSAPTN